MQNLFPLIVAFALGLGIGLIPTWIVRRRSYERVSQQKNESRLEIAGLTERHESTVAERNGLRERLAAAEYKVSSLQEVSQKLAEERARLEERANRVSTLESQLIQNTAEMQKAASQNSALEQQALRVPGLEDKLIHAHASNEQVTNQLASAKENLGAANAIVNSQMNRIHEMQAQLSEIARGRDTLLADQEGLKTQIAQLNTSLDAERRQAEEKLSLLSKAEERLTTSFKVLAADILAENSARFGEENRNRVGQVLDPLKIKIEEFQSKVDQVYFQESKDRTALSEQVKQLLSLNQQLSQDATNLTQALKGSSKTQGNWGEMILERVLENSGLKKGSEYFMRPTYRRGDNTKAQPDAVIALPESRNLVVDAKVSLVAYEEYMSAQGDSDRADAIQRHISSIRTHIGDLGTTNYQSLEALKSLDFVVMFVPIEPALILALHNDPRLWQEAWRKNVLLVGPSMLLFAVRTVANLWRQELQKKNIQAIVSRGAELYDKLAGFVEDLMKVGDRLINAKESYDSAYAKLHTGRGNVIRQAEMLKDLGVKPTKSLPPQLVEASIEVPILPEHPIPADAGAEPGN